MITALWALGLIALATFALWAYLTAQRLDRLHIRVDRSRDALQAALDRRCAVIAVIVPELSAAARRTEEFGLRPEDLGTRMEMEDALRVGVDKHEPKSGRPRDLEDADTRVLLALRFYNEAVRDTRAIRLRTLVRTLRLGGTARMPEYCSLGALGTTIQAH